MLPGLMNFLNDAYFKVFGCSYLSTFEEHAHITDKGRGKSYVTPQDLDFVLQRLDSYKELKIEYAYHGYGCKAGNTPEHEEVLSRIFKERTTPLRKLLLSQNCLSEAGMKKIIVSLDSNFATLRLEELLVTRDSVQDSTLERLRELKREHPELKIVLREYGTNRDPRTGSGYNEELKV
jgi:hypothetical protein